MSGSLFDAGPATGNLTGHQECVLDALRTVEPQGLRAAAAGHWLHIWRTRCRYCNAEQACRYAEAQGRQVLEQLRRRGIAVRDRHHTYRLAPALRPDPAGMTDLPADY